MPEPAAPGGGSPGARSVPGPVIRRRALPPNAEALYADLHPVLARVYAARRVASIRELEHTLDRLHPFAALAGMEQAVELLYRALDRQECVLVLGDFDADGATGCTLAVRALRQMGAARVDYLVPNRFEYGYGLTPEIAAVAAHSRPQLLVTVDNGISSVAGVAAANALGMRVLITDHHLPGTELPAAGAIVNPNQAGDAFPSKHLAGVGVIFYVMLALRARLRAEDWFARRGIPEPNLAQLLDLVALGTVADVVPLDHNNRILVEQGLRRIRAGQCCAGITALLEAGGRNRADMVAADLGFAVAPRLNAAGRLEDMSLGIACLLADKPAVARELAARLDALNRERRTIEADMQAQALAMLETVAVAPGAGQGSAVGLCLFDERWHQGVIGILAARIKERVHRPVIAFAPADDQDIKGSARSIPGLHIRDVLDAVATRHPGLLQRFGGHAMAAGLTLARDRLDAFQEAFDAEVRRRLGPDDLQGVVYSDGELGGGDLELGLAEILRQGGPWGTGFPEPVFDGRFGVLERRTVGERHLKLRLRHLAGSRAIEAIAFNTNDSDWSAATQQVEVAYRLDVNTFRGARNLQLVVEHLAPV